MKKKKLPNGLHFSQFMGKVSDSIERDRAVSNYETKYQTNSQSVEQNNFGDGAMLKKSF